MNGKSIYKRSLGVLGRVLGVNSPHSSYPKKIIEHMEVDFALSRLYDRVDLLVFDIGAHHGEFLDIFGGFNHWHKWNVYCVEPLEENIRRIEKKISRYHNVNATLIPFGVSDVSGEKEFYLGDEDTLFTCSPDWRNQFPENFKITKIHNIDCLTITEIIERIGVAEDTLFDLVKVDVKGHDLNVIKSFCDSKINSRSIIFETPSNTETASECVDVLRAKGFDEFYIFGRTGIPTTYIGEYVDHRHLERLYTSGRILVSNIVGFSS